MQAPNVSIGAYPMGFVPPYPNQLSAVPTLGATSPVNTQLATGGPAIPLPSMTGAPQTGLIGSEQALIGGFTGAMGSLNQSSAQASSILGASANNIAGSVNPTSTASFNTTLGAGSIDPLNQAAGNFTGYMDRGANAAKMQADLTGANGPDAKAAAQAAQKPANDYAIQQAIRARERSAAARGGLFSGNTGLELNRDLAGIFSMNDQQNFNNLGSVAGQGLNAAGQVAGIKGNQAGLAAGLQQTGLGIRGNLESQKLGNDAQLVQQKNSIQASIASQLADIKQTTGQNQAQLYSQTGQQLGAGRENAGYAIAQNATNTANSISQLLKDQGIGVSDSMSADITTVSNLLHESGMQDSVDAKTLAQILANISGGQATNLQQGYQNVGNAQAAGILGVNNAVQGGLTNAIGAGVI